MIIGKICLILDFSRLLRYSFVKYSARGFSIVTLIRNQNSQAIIGTKIKKNLLPMENI